MLPDAGERSSSVWTKKLKRVHRAQMNSAGRENKRRGKKSSSIQFISDGIFLYSSCLRKHSPIGERNARGDDYSGAWEGKVAILRYSR